MKNVKGLYRGGLTEDIGDEVGKPSAPVDGSEFRVKPLQLWILHGLTEKRRGVWEVMSIYNIGSKDESCDIRRVMATNHDQKLGETWEKVPTWLIRETGKCVKFVTLYDSKTQNDPTEQRL